MKIQELYHGFRLKEKKEMTDIQSTTYLFEHEKTKARLFYIENDDLNKTFAVTFKTPPKDETGLSHILEHSVLSGSEKYPVKSPFLELRKSSLSTFLNAMTFPDKTMYPVSSRNDKDFKNLMDTYLNAVFYPLALEKEEIFWQEGWRYELNQETGELSYNGIVYNEMKGAYSSPDRQLISGIKKSLYPDNAYGLDSGGNPEKITELTYQDFKEYHQLYYHPSNSYVFLYGQLDIVEQLEYLDKEYLSRFEYKEIDTDIPLHKPFSGMAFHERYYALGKEQQEQKKTYITRNFVTGLVTDVEQVMAMAVLEKVLFDGNGSELKKRLTEADIAEEIDGFYYTVGLQPFFTFLARNSEKDHVAVFNQIIDQYLQEVVAQGIPKDLLKGAVNTIEFKLRESASSASRGISYAQSVMNSWLYGENPTSFLELNRLVASIRKKAEGTYFEELIQTMFLANPHSSQLFLLPQPGLEEKNNEQIQQALQQLAQNMSDEERNQIAENNRRLSHYHNTPDSKEALATLPVLDICDLDREQERVPMTLIQEDHTEWLLHPLFTNKISYTDLYFDTTVIPQDQIVYLYLLSDLLKRLSTKSYSYLELTNQINMYSGGIDFSVLCVNRWQSQDIRPMFRVGARCISENIEKNMELVLEILLRTNFKDKKKMKEEITELRALNENEILEDSMGIAQTRLASYFSVTGMYLEEGNLSYYYFLKDLFENFDQRFEELAGTLFEVSQKVFRRQGLVVGIADDQDEINEMVPKIKKALNELPDHKVATHQYYFVPQNKQEAIAIPAKVQYVIQGGSYTDKGFSYSGSLRVAAKLLNTDYLWQQLRVLGGAYGGFVSISIFGNIVFSSYRDPKLTETLEVYQKAADYLENLNLSEKELTRYVIGTMGDFDAPLNSASKARMSALYYFQQIEYDHLQKIRTEIIDTCLTDIKIFSAVLREVISQKLYCVIGSEEKIENNKEIFKEIIKI